MKKILFFSFILVGLSLKISAWGYEQNNESLSEEEQVAYHKRNRELQNIGEELYHIIINQDVDKFISLLPENWMIAMGVDYSLTKSEVTIQLKDKNSFLYCRLFKSPCEKIEVKSYELNGIKTIKLKSVRDYLKDAKYLKIKSKVKKCSNEEFCLYEGYIHFDWEGKKPFYEEETFASPFFVYLNGKWWLTSMFCDF